MASIKNRLERLEATAPGCTEDRITEIHRVIIGKTTPDGTPYIVVRSLTR